MSVTFRILQNDPEAVHLLGIAKQQALQYIENGHGPTFQQSIVIGKNSASVRANKVGIDWDVRIRLIAGKDSGGLWSRWDILPKPGRTLTIYRGGKSMGWGVEQTQVSVTLDAERGSYNVAGYYTLYINGEARATLGYSGSYNVLVNWPGGVPSAPRPGFGFFPVYSGSGESGSWSFPFDGAIQAALDQANAETKTRVVLNDGTELAAVVAPSDGHGHFRNYYRSDLTPWKGEKSVQLYNDIEYGTETNGSRTETPGMTLSFDVPEDVLPPENPVADAIKRDRARRVTATNAVLTDLKNGTLPKEIHAFIKAAQIGSSEVKEQPKLTAYRSAVRYTTAGNKNADEPWSYTFTSTTRVGYQEVEPGGRIQKDEQVIVGTFVLSATPIFDKGGSFRFFIYRFIFDSWLVVREEGGAEIGSFVTSDQSVIPSTTAYGNLRPALLDITGIDIKDLMRAPYGNVSPFDSAAARPTPSYDATYFDKPLFPYGTGSVGFFSVLQVRSGTITFGPTNPDYTSLFNLSTTSAEGVLYEEYVPPLQYASDTCGYTYPQVVQRYREKYTGPTKTETPLAQDFQPTNGTLIHVIPISIQHTELGNLGMFPRDADLGDVNKLKCRVDNVFYLKYDYVSGTFSFVKDKDGKPLVGKFTETVQGKPVEIPYKTFPYHDDHSNLVIRTNKAGYADVADIFKEQQRLIKERDGVDEPEILFYADLQDLVGPLL